MSINNSIPKRRVFALRRTQQQDTDAEISRMEAELRRLETRASSSGLGFAQAINGAEQDDSTTSSATTSSATSRMRSRQLRRKTRESISKVAGVLSSPFHKLVNVIQFSPQPIP